MSVRTAIQLGASERKCAVNRLKPKLGPISFEFCYPFVFDFQLSIPKFTDSGRKSYKFGCHSDFDGSKSSLGYHFPKEMRSNFPQRLPLNS